MASSSRPIRAFPSMGTASKNTISAAWGANFDRGFFGIAVEATEGDAVAYADRPWTEDCATYRERTTTGEISHDEHRLRPSNTA